MALTTQLEVIARQFDEMEDEYLRERKGDLEQITEKVLRAMQGAASPVVQPPTRATRKASQQDLLLDDTVDVPLILIAHDLSPADMLQFKQSVFAGFITTLAAKPRTRPLSRAAWTFRGGGRTPEQPAGTPGRLGHHRRRRQAWWWWILPHHFGGVWFQATPARARSRAPFPTAAHARRYSGRSKIELLANIEMPEDALGAIKAGAVGVGLFRSEFLFMGRQGKLPNEEEQYQAYRRAIEGMQGCRSRFAPSTSCRQTVGQGPTG